MTKLELISARLGRPAYSAPGVAIYQVDCVDAMRRLPPELFDLAVTSPPYNIGKEYEHHITIDNYVTWSKEWLDLIGRLLTPTGAFWLNLGYFDVPNKGKAVPISYLLWDKVPLFLQQEIVWHYGAGVATRHTFSPRNEKFLWYVKDSIEYTFNLDDVRDKNVKYPNQKKNGKLRCNPLGKNPSDVWEFAKVTSGADRSSPERTPHPAQFPIAVIDRILRACSNTGDVVFDPFMGSGTTAEAALNLGRDVVGFEIRPDYVAIIADRIERLCRAHR